MSVRALLVGVPAPSPFTLDGQRYEFDPIPGVLNDVEWFDAFISHVRPDRNLTVLTEPDETTARMVTDQLAAEVAQLSDGDTMVLFLAGHGFRVPDQDGDEQEDVYDEVFAAWNTGILDDEFALIWGNIQVDANVVVIADTCSADSQGILGGETPSVVYQPAPPPRRLGIAAAMSWEEALEHPTSRGERGVMTKALEDAWLQMSARTSYRTWFEEAATFVAVRSPQHPRLRSIGPDSSLMDRVPFE